MNRGLSRRQRIPASCIKDVFQEGTSCPGRFMVMWTAPNNVEGCRFAVVSGKRTFPDAVDRNRARRRLREAYRLNQGIFEGARDVVLVARRRILKAEASEIQNELVRLWSRLGVPENTAK